VLHYGSDGTYTSLMFLNQLVELLPEVSVAKSKNKDDPPVCGACSRTVTILKKKGLQKLSG